mgnify:CR=1 FL=1
MSSKSSSSTSGSYISSSMVNLFNYLIIYLYINVMGKTIIAVIPDELWEKLIKRAIKKYGHHGGIKKTVIEALEKLLKE